MRDVLKAQLQALTSDRAVEAAYDARSGVYDGVDMRAYLAAARSVAMIEVKCPNDSNIATPKGESITRTLADPTDC